MYFSHHFHIFIIKRLIVFKQFLQLFKQTKYFQQSCIYPRFISDVQKNCSCSKCCSIYFNLNKNFRKMSIVDRFGLNYKNRDIIRHKLLESANKSNKYVQNIYHNNQLF